MAGHILGNGMIAFLVLPYQHGVRTKNYITILFKKIKYFLIIGLSAIFCFMFLRGPINNCQKKDHEFLPGRTS